MVTISSLIYKSPKYADWVYNSLIEFTPMIKKGEAEFFFVANGPTEKLLQHLKTEDYPYIINNNPIKTEEELFKMGYGKPTYIHYIYRGYNKAIQSAKGNVVVLINSDNFFSPNWLENLLKHLTPTTIVCSKLVERNHPKYGIIKGAYRGEFGSDINNFKKEDFLNFCNQVSKVGLIEEGGVYQPCVFYKDLAEKVGLYPEGNLAGSSFNEVIEYGDKAFFKKLAKIGVKHITSLDSIVYHIKEGEKDDE